MTTCFTSPWLGRKLQGQPVLFSALSPGPSTASLAQSTLHVNPHGSLQNTPYYRRRSSERESDLSIITQRVSTQIQAGRLLKDLLSTTLHSSANCSFQPSQASHTQCPRCGSLGSSLTFPDLPTESGKNSSRAGANEEEGASLGFTSL